MDGDPTESTPQSATGPLDHGVLASWLLRGGLLGAGFVCWNGATLLWEGGSCASSLTSTILMLLAYLFGFAMLIGAALERPHERARWLVLGAVLMACLCYAQNHRVAQLENGLLTTDVRLYMDHAARLLRHGENPYAADLLESYRINRAPFNFSTPLLDGDLTGRVAYPALSILIFLPFQWLGWPADWVYPVFLVLTFVLLFVWAPRMVQPLVLLPFFLDPRYVLYTLGGVSDVVWALLLVVMLRAWHRPRHRALWYGLACAFKHQPWVLAPFLLIRLWHETSGPSATRWRELLRFAGWAIFAFAVVNLPFFIWSPTAWFAAVFEPLVAPMITFGQGLSALMMFGRIVIPKLVFTLFMVGALAMALYAYHRHHARLRTLLWIAPGLMLWLSNRSLTSYWYFYLIPLLYDLVRPPVPLAAPVSGVSTSERPWRPTVLALGMGLLALLGCLTFLSRLPERLQLQIVRPMVTLGNDVVRLQLSVRNVTKRQVEPRFAVQALGLQPFFWHIESGPRVLGRGQRALYTISTDEPFARFEVRRGARVTVSHAGSQQLRSSIPVKPDRTYVYPDVIPNPNYAFWSMHGQAPTFWGIVSDPQGAGSIKYRKPSGPGAPLGALAFELESKDRPTSLYLDTYLDLPQHDVEIAIKRPRGANLLPDLALVYGLRLVVDEIQVLVLFGDKQTTGRINERLRYVMLRAPEERWGRHRLSLPAILRSVGVDPLPRRHRMPRFGHLDFPMVPANIQLFFARRVGAGVARCSFGPLRSLGLKPDTTRLFAAARRQPAALPYWRGQFNFVHRNFKKARDWFAKAAVLDHSSPRVQLQLGEAEFWLGRHAAAIKAFAKALTGDERTKAFAYKGIGWSHYNQHQYEEALLAWRSAAKLLASLTSPAYAGHRADIHKGMMMALLQQGRCQLAVEEARKARRLMPTLSLPVAALDACRGRLPTSQPASQPH